jgi:hypothetical protein
MTTIDQKKDMNKKQEDKDTKEDQIEETLENASDTVVAESKKEANQIGDSDRE